MLRSARGIQQRASVKPEFETADIVVGVLASLGVVVLIVVFIMVFRAVILKKD
jgi:hypothetical protein